MESIECLGNIPLEPCVFVIPGATGDLANRKLLPALFNLFKNKALPEPFLIIGCGRTRIPRKAFQERTRASLERAGILDPGKWGVFSNSLFYKQLSYHDAQSGKALARYLKSLDRKEKTRGNRIFYLALPPALYGPVAGILGKAGLGLEKKEGWGWSRLVVEKPFGYDLESALRLDREIRGHFEEHQVFRIDHYLAKETVQNILTFRFANAVFEPIWNRRYIDSIHIMAVERLGVEHRAGYYDQAGVIRDMFQNHMMQLLAMVTMEPPPQFESDAVRDEKIKVFRSLRPFPVDALKALLVLGQYTRGFSGQTPLPAYREEPGVRPGSLTPTYALMKVFIDNWRWQGVPIFLESGKRLKKKRTEILITFKDVPHLMFQKTFDEAISPNRLVLGIYPEEHIQLTFQTKSPGVKMCLKSAVLDFKYHQESAAPVLEAYEKVLIDCMTGDQMLFWRQDGVKACWSFLTPILNACETCAFREAMLHLYPAGGPRLHAARILLGS